MTAADAVSLLSALRPRTVLPVHYEGWAHFKEGRAAAERAFAAAPASLRDSVRWLTPGVPVDLA